MILIKTYISTKYLLLLLLYLLLILYRSCNLAILIYYWCFIAIFLIFYWSSIDPRLICLFSLYWPDTCPTNDHGVICHWSSINLPLILYLWLVITHLFDLLGMHCFLVWWWKLSIKLQSHAAFKKTTFMNFKLVLSFQICEWWAHEWRNYLSKRYGC